MNIYTTHGHSKHVTVSTRHRIRAYTSKTPAKHHVTTILYYEYIT